MHGTHPARRTRRTHPPRRTVLILTAALAVFALIAVQARWGTDWAAQTYRARLAVGTPWALWDNNWFGGQALVGYSVLTPTLMALLGAPAVGAGACVVCVWAVDRVVRDAAIENGWAITLAAAVSLAGALVVGQVTLLAGVAAASVALLALSRDRPVAAAALAAVSSLLSPLAGVLLLLVAVGLSATTPVRRLLTLSPAVLGTGVALLLGGADGTQPYPRASLVVALLICAAGGVGGALDTSPYRPVVLRTSAAYAAACIILYLHPNSIGGNVLRFGRLLVVPVAVLLLVHASVRRRPVAVVAVVGALAWFALPPFDAVRVGSQDASRSPAYYSGLLTFLRSRDPLAGRLEIPMTADHWESTFVASAFPLARGWDRQSDRAYNPVLYAPLDASAYRRWLSDNSVRLVALPSTLLDQAGRAEAALLTHAPDYLTPVWHDADWRVWRVRAPTAMAVGAGRLTDLDAASFDVDFARAGTSIVHIRASRLWDISAGRGCLSTARGGWLRLDAPGPGTVRVTATLNPSVFGAPEPCST